MALTALQRRVCLLADQRKRSGESYVAGGVALDEIVAGARRSRDIDLFHDTQAALVATWASDRRTLEATGLHVETVRELPGFVEARVRDVTEAVLVQWAQDSAFRFFVQSEIDGLDFDGPVPRAGDLSARWHAASADAREVVRALPADEAEECVLDREGRLE